MYYKEYFTMKNISLWVGAIVIGIGVLCYNYINQEQYRTESDDYEQDSSLDYNEEDYATEGYSEKDEVSFFSNRNYDEPRVRVDAGTLYSSYNSNSIRAKTLYDGKLIEITDSPLKVDIAPDGDGIIHMANGFFRDPVVYAKGGKEFKAEAAKLISNYNDITLLCYSDEFLTDNPILTDCIFDLKTNSKREADRTVARIAREKKEEEQRKADEVYAQEAENLYNENIKANKAAEERANAETESKAKEQRDRIKAEEARSKADEARMNRESMNQNNVETEPYNTTYVDDNGLADVDYFD